MDKIFTLDTLKLGERCQVEELQINGDMRRRLQDLGLIDGTKVQCVLVSPLGNPKAYEIRGAVIALRNEDCKKILVKAF